MLRGKHLFSTFVWKAICAVTIGNVLWTMWTVNRISLTSVAQRLWSWNLEPGFSHVVNQPCSSPCPHDPDDQIHRFSEWDWQESPEFTSVESLRLPQCLSYPATLCPISCHFLEIKTTNSDKLWYCNWIDWNWNDWKEIWKTIDDDNTTMHFISGNFTNRKQFATLQLQLHIMKWQ